MMRMGRLPWHEPRSRSTGTIQPEERPNSKRALPPSDGVLVHRGTQRHGCQQRQASAMSNTRMMTTTTPMAVPSRRLRLLPPLGSSYRTEERSRRLQSAMICLHCRALTVGSSQSPLSPSRRVHYRCPGKRAVAMMFVRLAQAVGISSSGTCHASSGCICGPALLLGPSALARPVPHAANGSPGRCGEPRVSRHNRHLGDLAGASLVRPVPKPKLDYLKLANALYTYTKRHPDVAQEERGLPVG